MGEPMDRTRSPFVTQTTFDATFPGLEDAIVEGTIGESAYPRNSIRFTIHGRGGSIHCPNPKCWSGGFIVDFPAEDMKRKGIPEMAVRIRCEGRENSHKGRRTGQPCPYSLEGTIKLVPKASAPDSGA